MYHVWYSFTEQLFIMFGTHLPEQLSTIFDIHIQNNYILCFVVIYRIIMYHVWYSFTEYLCIMFGTYLQNNDVSCLVLN